MMLWPSTTKFMEQSSIKNLKRKMKMENIAYLRIMALTVVWELVEFNEVMPVLVNVDGLSFVVIFRSNVDTYNSAGDALLGLNNDGEFIGLVVKTFQVSLNLGVLVLVSNWVLVDYVVKRNFVVAEVGDEIADVNLLNLDTGDDDVIVLVRRQRLLVVVEEMEDLAVQLVEGRVSDSGLAKFKNGWGVFEDVVEFGRVADELAGYSLEAAVVSGVDTPAGTFDQFSKDVETLRLVQRQERSLRGDYVSGIDSVNDSLLQSLNQFHQFVVMMTVVEMNLIGALGEFKTVKVTKVGPERSLDMIVFDILNGCKSVTETVQIVTGKKLLVEVVVVSTVADLVEFAFFDASALRVGLLTLQIK